MMEKMIDDSSFEVLQPTTPQRSGDDLFQSQVLGILEAEFLFMYVHSK